MPAYGFTPALHQVSVLQGILASANRTPHKIAIEENHRRLSYTGLRDAITANDVAGSMHDLPAGTRLIVQWLAAAHASGKFAEEDEVFIDRPLALSNRTIVLRLLCTAVSHDAFSRDVVSGMALPLATAAGTVAALLPLWLGGTLRLFEPTEAAALAQAIGNGSINQAWLGQEGFAALREQRGLPPAPLGFRLLVCDGLPDPDLGATLRTWLGSPRVTAQTGTEESGPLKRHPALDREGEPYPGVLFSTTGAASSLASTPSSPVWRSIPNAV